jgi:hypothetical protein
MFCGMCWTNVELTGGFRKLYKNSSVIFTECLMLIGRLNKDRGSGGTCEEQKIKGFDWKM